jgi:hypothetical protein
MWPVVAVLGVGFLLALGFIALVTSQSPATPDLQSEYDVALSTLRFPPGFSAPLVDPNSKQTGVAFERGTGAVDAGNLWFCAWVLAWDAAREKVPERAQIALNELVSAYPTNVFWRSLATQDGRFLRGVVEDARTGDPAALRDQITAFGCTGHR